LLTPNAALEMTSPDKFWISDQTSSSVAPTERVAEFSHLSIRSLHDAENDGNIRYNRFQENGQKVNNLLSNLFSNQIDLQY
jgi:hypothetical protein